MKKETAKEVGIFSKSYLNSVLRSVIQDIVLSASDESFAKAHDYDEFKEHNSENEIDKKEYYEINGYALNVPTYEKGPKLNKFIIDKFLKKYLEDEHMNSNYLMYKTAIKYMINNPDIISDFYEVEENQSPSAIGKIMKKGHTKDGDYNDAGLEYMFNYDFYGDDENKKPLDRIKRGILVVQMTQTNIDWLESQDNATDSIVVTGATLTCSVSGSTSTFTATALGNWATAMDKPIASIKDDTATNIGSFGHCPAIDKTCKFQKAGSGWMNSDCMSFGGEDTLTDKSYIQCIHGGTIKVNGSGQDLMKTNTKGSGK